MKVKIQVEQLKVGMFVSDLDRPWLDTPFLLQGFLIEDQEEIAKLRYYCKYVMVDRARSSGDEFQADAVASVIPVLLRGLIAATACELTRRQGYCRSELAHCGPVAQTDRAAVS